ncbi:MAG: hypothetical protein ACW98U_13875 [Candidatus Thorarchaeota archaeon]|jgi:hypothetical protein
MKIMIERKKLKLLKVSVAVAICLGLMLVPVVTASLPGYPDTTMTTLFEGDFALVATYDFTEGHEVYVELTMIDPPHETDLDVYIVDPSWNIIWLGGSGPEFYEDPTIAERGYFAVVTTDTYYIYVDAYYIPDENGVEIELYVDCDENLLVVEPLESSGFKYGTLNSYVQNSANAKYHASEKSAFRRGTEITNWVPSILKTRDGFLNFLTTANTLNTLPAARFCADDPIGIGGLSWYLPAQYYDFETACLVFDYYYYEWYIDGTLVSDWADMTSVPAEIIIDRGEEVYYAKMQDSIVFKAGELAEEIGYGMHELVSWVPNYPGGGAGFVTYFWLLPEGSVLT